MNEPENIKIAQRLLSTLDYGVLLDTGLLDVKTKEAVKKARADLGLPMSENVDEPLLEALSRERATRWMRKVAIALGLATVAGAGYYWMQMRSKARAEEEAKKQASFYERNKEGAVVFGRGLVDEAALGLVDPAIAYISTPEERAAWKEAKSRHPAANVAGRAAGFGTSLLWGGGEVALGAKAAGLGTRAAIRGAEGVAVRGAERAAVRGAERAAVRGAEKRVGRLGAKAAARKAVAQRSKGRIAQAAIRTAAGEIGE